MAQPFWENILLSQDKEDMLYELFHENSKIERHTERLSQSDVLDHLKRLDPSLPYEGYPRVDLPADAAPQDISLFQTMRARVSVRSFSQSRISLKEMATILFYGYGVTRMMESVPRGLRTVPSAGALYPLEVYVHTSRLENHPPGIYHYNPEEHCLRLIQAGDATEVVRQSIVQPDILAHATACIFITAIFERSTFKYQDRGYRFALIEAGHAAQNINLVACGLGMASVNIGGFYDREIDALLGLDGVTQSTLYIIAIGRCNDSASSRTYDHFPAEGG